MEKNKIDVELIVKDLTKYGEKLNAMMYASMNGEAPQIMKFILAKKLFSEAIESFKKDNNEKIYLQGEKLVDKFLELYSQGIVTKKIPIKNE